MIEMNEEKTNKQTSLKKTFWLSEKVSIYDRKDA